MTWPKGNVDRALLLSELASNLTAEGRRGLAGLICATGAFLAEPRLVPDAELAELCLSLSSAGLKKFKGGKL